MHPNSDPHPDITGHHHAVSAWYEKDELGICPQCGRQSLLPPKEMAEPRTICLSCGVLSAPGEPPGAQEPA
jgi:hypothetical protein